MAIPREGRETTSAAETASADPHSCASPSLDLVSHSTERIVNHMLSITSRHQQEPPPVVKPDKRWLYSVCSFPAPNACSLSTQLDTRLASTEHARPCRCLLCSPSSCF